MIQFGPEEVHLINMAVEPLFQNMGLGRKLLHHFLDTNAPNTSIFLEVKLGNFPAINLYLSAGFEEITIRQKYYTEGEDAIIMCLKVWLNFQPHLYWAPKGRGNEAELKIAKKHEE